MQKRRDELREGFAKLKEVLPVSTLRGSKTSLLDRCELLHLCLTPDADFVPQLSHTSSRSRRRTITSCSKWKMPTENVRTCGGRPDTFETE